ncbi:cytochrome P450 [Armillaria gallica]|uniref:Cytochrome P450 n=1 Tax=Armillaria gallica TaxID=47427 RepID=A0A2H3DL56_ARMGA|nr:cytochrome P450 [Armillaria gallica]
MATPGLVPSNQLLPCLLSLSAAALACVLLYRRWKRISIDQLPGPQPQSFLLGNLGQFYRGEAAEADFAWQQEFGHVLRIKGAIGEDCLFLSDPKAIHHVHHSGYTYQKQTMRRELARLLLGKGMPWAEAEDHKRQRKVMSPAFGSAETKALFPIIFEAAELLCSKWNQLDPLQNQGSAVVDAYSWMCRTTIDTIGLAAFGYRFHALEEKDNALRQAYAKTFSKSFGNPSKWTIFKQNMLQYLPAPVVSFIFNHSASFDQARETKRLATQVSEELLRTKSSALRIGNGGRDILSLLIKANMDTGSGPKLDHEEMLASMQVVIAAGLETTASTLTWTLFELSRHPYVQAKLRDEIRGMPTANGGGQFTPGVLEDMPYTHAESLRLHPSIYYVLRQAAKDDIIPTSTPITTRSGQVINEIPVAKGTSVFVSIAGYNRNASIFGDDSHSFNPERWLDNSMAKTDTPLGLYGNLMSFGSGVRSCMGWRFALLEYQTILIQLIDKFHFSIDSSVVHKIRREGGTLIMSPTVDGIVQLPLRISAAET